MELTVKEAAKEARIASAESLTPYGMHQSLDDFKGLLYDEIVESAFIKGAEWQAKRMAWISVDDKMPEDGHIIDDSTIYSHTKDVIVLYKNGYTGKGKRIFVNGINTKGWQWSCLKGEDITHWMYFPD